MALSEPLRPSVVGPDGAELSRGRIQEQPPSKDFNYYSWGRLGRLLIERDLREVLDATPTDTPFVYLDACSSVPWLREVMIGQYAKNDCLRAAKAAVSSFEDRFKVRDETVFPGFRKMRQEKMNEVRASLFTRGVPPRQMLEAVAFDAFFDPEEGLNTADIETLSVDFSRRFRSDGRVMREVLENSTDGEIKGSWVSLVFDDVPYSIADIVHSTGLTDVEADMLLDAMANHFAQQFAGKIRRTKFLSLDLEGVEKFKPAAIRNFPTTSLNIAFFKRILDPTRHIEGDIRHLQAFEDNEVSVYSMIEGFPFYAEYFSDSEAIQVLSEARRVLRDGGKFIAFPWLANDGRDLSGFEEFLRRNGFSLTVDQKTKESLVDGMGPREKRLVARSPVFTDTGDTLSLLVATKLAA